MLSLLKKIFGATPTEASPAPYKVETPVAHDQAQVIAAAEASATTTQPAPVSKPAKKAPAAKKTTARKPRTPKA